MKRLVRDVMTADVVVAAPTTPFKEVARLLAEHRVSALPVMAGDGRLLGVVSEADLLRKEELPPLARDPAPGWGVRAARRRTATAKAAALVAEDLMTAPAVTVAETATMAEAARTLHGRQVRQAPVVDGDGRLVGIVSRSDLLRPYLTDDTELAASIISQVLDARLGLPWGAVRVEASHGVVTLSGAVRGPAQARSLVEAVGRFDGVVGVVDHLRAGKE